MVMLEGLYRNPITGQESLIPIRVNASGEIIYTTSSSSVDTNTDDEPLGVIYPRMDLLHGVIESGNNVTGYGYMSNSSGWSSYAVCSTVGLVGDGWISCSSITQNAIIGFKLSNTNGNYTTIAAGIYFNENNIITALTDGSSSNGAANLASSPTLPAVNTTRLRREGSTLYAEVSTDSGVSWTAVHQWVSFSTAKLYICTTMQGLSQGFTGLKASSLT